MLDSTGGSRVTWNLSENVKKYIPGIPMYLFVIKVFFSLKKNLCLGCNYIVANHFYIYYIVHCNLTAVENNYVKLVSRLI